jgi:hypothetical protein
MINRRHFSIALAAGAAASVASPFIRAQTAALRIRNVVLVHGAYADGSCWSEVIGRLQAAGLHATAVQNPLSALHGRPHEGQDHRTGVEPCFAHLASARDRCADSRGRGRVVSAL